MSDNKKMLQFAGYLYPYNKACLVCEHVFEKIKAPQVIVHDEDGWLQFLCGDSGHEPENSKVVSLGEMIERLPKQKHLPILKLGELAEMHEQKFWRVAKLEK